MPPQKRHPTALDALVTMMCATFADDTALSVELGELGSLSTERVQQLLDNPKTLKEFFSNGTLLPTEADTEASSSKEKKAAGHGW